MNKDTIKNYFLNGDYAIIDEETGRYFCADIVLSKFFTNVRWSKDKNKALKFNNKIDAQDTIDSDPFPMASKVVKILS